MIIAGKKKADVIKFMEENDKKNKAKIRLETAEANLAKTKKDQASAWSFRFIFQRKERNRPRKLMQDEAHREG